jgi:integrase
VWLIRWYDDFGKMKAQTFHGAANEAEEECRRLEQELNEGTLGRRRKIHWLDFCHKYLDDLKHHARPRTVADYKQTLEALTNHCQPNAMEELTVTLLRSFVNDTTSECSPATRNKLIRTLRAILNWAVPDYLKANPADALTFSEEPERDRRTLTPSELDQVLRVADDRGKAVLLLGACAGLRREEIAALSWEDLDLSAATVRVRNSQWHTTKSGRQRTLLVSPLAVEVLTRMKAVSQSPFAFPDVYLSYRELPNPLKHEWSRSYRRGLTAGQGRVRAREAAWREMRVHQHHDRPIAPDRLTDLVPRLLKKAKLPHGTLHDLRRTFCTYLAAHGADPLAAQKLAGHSSPVVTAKHYVGVVPDFLKAQERLPHWSIGLSGAPG